MGTNHSQILGKFADCLHKIYLENGAGEEQVQKGMDLVSL
jgi:hypothetical protein